MKKFNGYMRGINLGGWLSQCVAKTTEHFDNFIVEDDIRQISEWGFDHIRLPIDYDVIETEDGQSKEDGHKHISDCIAWCRKYGLHVVLDLHKAYGFMFDLNEVSDPDKFFTDESLQERFYHTWDELIARYGEDRDIVAFELLNEVVNPDFKTEWNRIATNEIRRIREKYHDAYIIVGGVMHNSVLSVSSIDVPIDDCIVYNFHCYEPLCFTHQHAHWVENIDYDLNYPEDISVYREKSRLLNQNHACDVFSVMEGKIGPQFFEGIFKEALDFIKERDLLVYCGEYGVIDRAPIVDAKNWISDINEVFEKNGIGRALWNYKQKDFGFTDERLDSIRGELLDILCR